MIVFKPQLACEADLDKLRWPVLASAKLDGVRAIVRDGVVLSRSLKPIPNRFVQRNFKHLEHYDGELIFGEPTAKDVYRKTVSAVMGSSTDGVDVKFYVFDHVEHPTRPYLERFKRLTPDDRILSQRIHTHQQHHVMTLDNLLKLEAKYLDEGYEGLILRDPTAPYKFGRSTAKEGYLLKLKRFTDAEFKVVGFEERNKNCNTATTNELGRTKRSSHQENMVGRGDLGALVLQGNGFVFNVGTGFDDVQRQEIWDNRDEYRGQFAKVKYFAIGMKDAPRHPVFLGWRDARDIS